MRACPQCQRTYPDDTDFCPRDGSPLPPDSLHRVIPADAGIQIDANLAAGLSRRFRIVRRLGAGGMGRVLCRAERRSAQGRAPLAPTPPWRLALKVLNRKLLDDPEFLLRFQNEAASTGRIHHANVVTIYESGQADDGTPYIAMEFLEGESLCQALTWRGALPLPEVTEILQQTARGLNAAHKLGIIHRDLKPDNIFLTYPDDVGATLVVAPGQAQGPPLPPVVVKIVDFGIAKLRESGAHTLGGFSFFRINRDVDVYRASSRGVRQTVPNSALYSKCQRKVNSDSWSTRGSRREISSSRRVSFCRSISRLA